MIKCDEYMTVFVNADHTSSSCAGVSPSSSRPLFIAVTPQHSSTKPAQCPAGATEDLRRLKGVSPDRLTHVRSMLTQEYSEYAIQPVGCFCGAPLTPHSDARINTSRARCKKAQNFAGGGACG